MHRKFPKFLASEIPDLQPEDCLFHVIPAPYEKTVSYGSGTSDGPWAILKASYQLEAYDGISEPCAEGIYTHPPCELLTDIDQTLAETLDLHCIPIVLGGEHTISFSAVKAFHDRGEPFGVVQFDAHADLRDQYEGTPWSHACVMKRVFDLGVPVFEIGTRSLSLLEEEFRRDNDIAHIDAVNFAGEDLPDILLPDDFPPRIYVTIDVDVFDPSIMPATGTPEPGGLNWYQVMHALELLSKQRRIIGFDVVELAPIPHLHAPDFTVARMIYNLMGFIERARP